VIEHDLGHALGAIEFEDIVELNHGATKSPTGVKPDSPGREVRQFESESI
jgi:hypothetical protein